MKSKVQLNDGQSQMKFPLNHFGMSSDSVSRLCFAKKLLKMPVELWIFGYFQETHMRQCQDIGKFWFL